MVSCKSSSPNRLHTSDRVQFQKMARHIVGTKHGTIKHYKPPSHPPHHPAKLNLSYNKPRYTPTHHPPIARRRHHEASQLAYPTDDLPPAPLVLTAHPSNRLMRNGGVDALVLLPILNGDDASVREALDVPESSLEQRAHQAGEAGGRTG